YTYQNLILFPVRCYTCSKVIGNKEQTYENLLSQGLTPREALDQMNIRTTCCRGNIMNPPQIPLGLRINKEDKDIQDLYNSFGLMDLGNYSNTTGDPFYNAIPLDPNRPRPYR